MNRIDDERVCFYLRNREDIDQWCALRQEASRVLHTFLQESAEHIEALEPERGPDVKRRTRLRGKGNSYVRFFRAGWAVERTIRAAIGLEWPDNRVVFFPRPRREPAYVSVWVNRGTRGGADLAARLRERLWKRARKLGLSRGASTSSHPVWRYQSPKEEEYWKDLSGFRQQVIDDIQLFWDEFADEVEAALAAADG